MRKLFIVLVFTLGTTSAAQAVPVTFTYTGLAGGNANADPTGYLCNGPFGCRFSNVPVILTYHFDVPLGATSFSNAYPNGDGIPTAYATLSIDGNYLGTTPDGYNGAGSGYPDYRVEFISSTSQQIIQSIGYHGGGLDSVETDLGLPYPHSLFDQEFLTGLHGSGTFNIGLGTQGGIEGGIQLETLSVNGGVPEPSTWAMMLIGFAGIGYLALRRQRRLTAQESRG